MALFQVTLNLSDLTTPNHLIIGQGRVTSFLILPKPYLWFW